MLSTDDSNANQRQFSSQRYGFTVTTQPRGVLGVDAAFGVALIAFGLDQQGNQSNGSVAAPPPQPSNSIPPSGSTASPTTTPDCPGVDTLNKALADFGNKGTIIDPPLCSGPWAVGSPNENIGAQKIAYTALFNFENGKWVEVNRTGPCDNNEVPADIYQPACQSN